MKVPPPLWGGVLEGIAIDLIRQVISMQIRVESSAGTPSVRNHSLMFDNVTDFHWHSAIPGPWSYAEVTEVHVSSLASGEVLAEIMLWSEEAGMTIKAGSALLDGTELTTE